jgi:ABC-type polysaccharide/polyol phosphate transport system ATPase subunit
MEKRIIEPGAPHAIEVRDLTKVYRRYERFRYRFREILTLGLVRGHRKLHALDGVSVSVKQGEALALIGDNGCGKSTLMKVLAGVCTPNEGDVDVRGRVASLLELGTGFNLHFTGRENALLQAALHGLNEKECAALLPFIEDFAGVGDAFDQPLRTFSSGMVVRLAFAAAVAVEPDLLLVDEALAVGDAEFQARCIARMTEFKEMGRTIVFVSHDLHAVRSFCTRALLMEHGRVLKDGLPSDVCAEYEAMVASRKTAAPSLPSH